MATVGQRSEKMHRSFNKIADVLTIRGLLTLGAIVLLVATLIDFQKQDLTIYRATEYYDTRFIAAMKNLTMIIPPKSVLVVSYFVPQVTYFTGHDAKAPYGIDSEEALVEYMNRSNYRYLVVFEGRSEIDALQLLFSSAGIRDLDPFFIELARFSTDYSGTVHLYELRI